MCFAPQRRALFRRPKVVRAWCVLYILTSKCASRHSGVLFFISHLASWLRTRRFSGNTQNDGELWLACWVTLKEPRCQQIGLIGSVFRFMLLQRLVPSHHWHFHILVETVLTTGEISAIHFFPIWALITGVKGLTVRFSENILR